MAFKYLTFDCYGTLIDWRKGIETELRSAVGDLRIGGLDLLRSYMAAEKAQESSYKKYRAVLRDTVLSMSDVLGAKVTSKMAEEFSASVPRWPAFPDTGNFLKDAGRQGCKRYILSNVDDDLLEGTIRNNDLEVDGFVTAEQVGSYKPAHGHWDEFFRRTGAAKSETLHIAQSVFHDIFPTQEIGIPNAWVNRYGEPLPPGASPWAMSDSLANLAGIIR